MNQRKLFLLWHDLVFCARCALRSSIAKNAASLYVIHVANYILPLITIPYLVRVLKPAGFGMVAFAQSIITYFGLFVDYGFGLSATRKISVRRGDPQAVSHIVFSTWAAKILLCLIGFVLLVILTNIVPKLREISALLIILYGMTVGNVFFPTWLFQGMEKMAFICIINLIMRLFVVAAIFTLVRHPEDYLLYAGLLSFGSIGAGLAGIGFALSKFKLRARMPSFRSIWHALVEGWILFLSTASGLYTVGNPFILGLLTNHTVVGYYSAAEKIVRSILGFLGPISQASYPRFSKMASESKTLALQWGRRMLALMGGLGFILSLSIFIFSPRIVRIILGPDYEPSIMVMRILSGLCFFIAISNVLGIQIMLSFKKDKEFTFILFGAAAINIFLAILMTPIWRESGMAIAVLLTETFVTVTMFVYLSLHQLSPLNYKELK